VSRSLWGWRHLAIFRPLGAGMTGYLVSRIVAALVLLAVVTILNFLMTHVLPGDPVTALVGQFPAPPAYVALIRHDYGLDQPLTTQLWLYLGNLIHGNLGYSFGSQRPVLPLILAHARITLALMVPALVVASIVGVLLGGAAARRVGSIYDVLLSAVSVAGYSTPIFWLAQILIIAFAIKLPILPAQGIQTIGATDNGAFASFTDYLQHLVLPGSAIAFFNIAVVARVARASMYESLHQDYTLLALAKGLRPTYVYWRHVMPNALIPIITVIGYNFGSALTGAILTETVFGWPGIGTLFVASITKRDYPVLEGIFLLTSLAVLVVNLITDLTYAVIDPRVARSYQGTA
jgi:peptide/nickel transport system permease protein